MAGVSRLQYSSEVRLVRVMCSGRIDLGFILRAFSNGNDGVFIGGCRLNECNYVTHGNYDALGVTHICKNLLARMGLNPERLHIAFMSGGDGNLLAEYIDKFTKEIKEIGPLGTAEGIGPELLGLKLEAASKLVPFLRLVERERLRAPAKSKEAYEKFFASDEFDRLFDEIVADKLAVSQIMLLLRGKSLSAGEIGKALGLTPSEVSRHMSNSSRQGLVTYDESRNCFALA